MSSIIRFLSITGLLLMPVLHAQTTIEFDRITIEQGLSMNTVNAIVQDADGFIWFATSNGLNRYDGHSITIWHNDPADSQSLPFPRVQAACMDTRGRLWVGTFGGGMGLLDERTGTFRNIRRNGTPRGLTSNYIRSLHTSDTDPDILWVGTNDAGVCALDLNRMEFITLPPLPQAAVIYALVSDEDRNLWSGTSRGLMLLDRSAGRWLPFTLSDGPAPQVFAAARDARGTLWLGTDRGLMEWDTRAQRVMRTFTYYPHAPASLSNNHVWAIASDTSVGVLWVGTDNGLNRIYTSSGRVDRFVHNPLDPYSVAHNITWALYRDRAGDIWGGTYGGGAYRINKAKETFHHIRFDPGTPISISANDVYSLFEDRLGYLWVGTDAGLDVLHRGDRKRLIHPALRFGVFPRIPRSFHEDRNGNVWIGTIGSGLYRFDRRSGQLIHYPPEPAYDRGLSHANVSVIREAVDGTLWIGTLGGGLNAWDPRTQQFSRYLHAAGDSFSIADNLIYDLEIDSLGDLWIGTASGLSRMDPRSGRSLNFLHNPSDSTTLSNDVVECVRLSSAGHPWIGTLYGLNCYDPLSGRMHRFSTRDGLPSNKIYGILEDAGGDLWISTANGLSRFRIEGYGTDGRPQIATRNFFRSDGLQSNEFTQGLCFKNRNGELYFAGVNGITVFHPDHVRTALDTPLVILTSFKKFDQTVRLPQRLSELAELMLAYEENFFGFEFVALDFHAPYKNRYKYRMEGFDHDWVYAGTRRYATYTNLDPGRYRFVVMGSNHDGVWNTREASIVVTILPPWWRTWWFRLTAVAVVAVAVWWLHRLRLRRLLDIERMRVRIASDLHDDIGATLTRIALRSETIQNLENGKDIRTAARHIGEMSREVIRVMSDIVWSIDARNDTMGDLVTRVQDTAFSLLSPREIQCRFDTTEIDANRTIQADVRQNIFLICKEALHNVARHSDATEVHVRFALRAGLSVTIRDNGTKSLPSESRGSGIRNMRMRAQRIGGSVEFIYEHGVTVRVRVPDAHPSSWGFLMRLKSLFLFS